MTDYNDGKWHRWAGDGIPPGVHEKSEVNIALLFDERPSAERDTYMARNVGWDKVCAFRVTKVHREPREFWICYDKRVSVPVVFDEDPRIARDQIIHVREVIE